MIYREYGKTGKKISIISAGGMRYVDPDDIDACSQVPLAAARAGVNYFDTAPYYSNDNSETILGAAIGQMKKEGLPFFVSTKSSGISYDDVWRDLERSLKRIGVPRIDFYHSWALNTPHSVRKREENGAFLALCKAKEQGLVSHVVCSSHMKGSDIAELLDRGIFEGITLGFNAINWSFRMEGLAGAKRNNLGVVTMNPLGGGTIIDHANRFSFIKTRSSQSILDAALHFNMSHSAVTSVLVGFRSVQDVADAVASVGSFIEPKPIDIEQIRLQIEKSFDSLCTSCNYCSGCPQDIPVAKLMEAYNYYILYGKADQVFERLKFHWDLHSIEMLSDCTRCRQCEKICNQKLPIIERFEIMQKLKSPIPH